MRRSNVAALWRGVEGLDRFARIHFVGFTSLWALLGAASAAPAPPTTALFGLVAVSILFHFYGGVLNDVIDLPVDRSQPRRAADPLVRGEIGRRTALAFALAQVPLAFALTVCLGGGARAHLLLTGAVVAMAIYDLAGKRCVVPPLTDGVQGLAWACLTLYGASIVGAANPTAAFVAAYGVGYALLINGVHGGMRDLENDLACGARTTAIFLGIRPANDSRMTVPRRARVYCIALQGGLVALTLAALLRGEPPYAWPAAAVVLAFAALCPWLMVHALRPAAPGWDAVFRLHLAALLLPIVALPRYGNAALAVTVLLLLFTPLLLLEYPRAWLGGGLRWLRREGLRDTAS